jgi:hypothetical protein
MCSFRFGAGLRVSILFEQLRVKLTLKSSLTKGWVSSSLRSYVDIRAIMVDDTKEIPDVCSKSDRPSQS